MYIGGVDGGEGGVGGGVGLSPMRKSFKDSLKVLEADIQHANTLASEFPREYDGACLQMRMSYSPAAHFLLFLVQWTDCHLAGALGLLRILIYKVYVDGTTTMSVHERKASIREFYAIIYPSLLQLERGVNDLEDKKQKKVCLERYKKRAVGESGSSEVDIERDEECGICLELNSKIVLPNCSHEMCMKCYRDWIRTNKTLEHRFWHDQRFSLIRDMMVQPQMFCHVQIDKAGFSFPSWFLSSSKKLFLL